VKAINAIVVLHFKNKKKYASEKYRGKTRYLKLPSFLDECRAQSPAAPAESAPVMTVFLSGWEKFVIFDRCHRLCRI